MRLIRACVVVALAMVGVAGCEKDMKSNDMKSNDMKPDGMMAMSQKSLYDRLGGQPAITAVIDDFVNRAAADPKVNFTRQGIPGVQPWQATPENVAKLKLRLVQFVSMATGGPKMYEGRDMKSSHAGMKITEAEFNALAGDLIASLDKFKVPQKEKDELIAVVGTTKKDIVEQR
jgi:hemoglobin